MTKLSKIHRKIILAALTGLALTGGMNAGAWAQTNPPTRVVTHPSWGGASATLYLAAMETNLQYPPGDMAIDNSYGSELNAWGDEPQDWLGMMPVTMPTDPSTATPGPQYLFTADKGILTGTSDTLTATLTIAQSAAITGPTNLQVVSAELIGTTAYDGQTVATVPYTCSGAVCTFTWQNPNTDAQYWGELALKVTVTSNGYPGTYVVYKHFYSSPQVAGAFTGQFTDSIVNGSLVINAGVTVNQHVACILSANLYSVDNNWPLQHVEQAMIVDPAMTSIPFTFFGKIFADYDDAGVFALRDLKAQCAAVPYPAEWYMDQVTYASQLSAWTASNPSPPDQPPFIYFAYNDDSYNTASYPNSAFSNAQYQSPQKTARLQALTTFANAEAAGTDAPTPHTDSNGNTTYTNALGGTDYLLFVHGRRDPNNCPNSTPVNPRVEIYGVLDNDECGLWPDAPWQITSTRVFVQYDAWNHYFNNTVSSDHGGVYELTRAIIQDCQAPNTCRIICHSEGCAVTECTLYYVSQNIGIKGQLTVVAGVLAAASAAGGSELANQFQGLPEGTITAHKVAETDASLTTQFTRTMYIHDNTYFVPVRGIGSDHLDNFWVEAFVVLGGFKTMYLGGMSNWNHDCFQVNPANQLACVDDDVAAHSDCAHNRWSDFEDCNTTLPLAGHSPDYAGTFDFHGWWIDDYYNSTQVTGPFSREGKGAYNSTYHTYAVSHGDAAVVASFEYGSCHNLGIYNWLCP